MSVQDSTNTPSKTNGQEDSADAPAEIAVTGLEDVQADTVDTQDPAEGNGSITQPEESGQADAEAEDSSTAALGGRNEESAHAAVDASSAGGSDGSDGKPDWAMQLRQQLQEKADGVKANAEGLFSALWERHGWKQGPRQGPTPPAEPPTAPQEQQHEPAEAAEPANRSMTKENSAAADTGLEGSRRAVGEQHRHFSIHRSHTQLFVSTAESVAASQGLEEALAEAWTASSQQRGSRRKVRFVPRAVLPEHGLREQPHQAVPALPPQPQDQLLQLGKPEMPDSAAGGVREFPTTEEEEEQHQSAEGSWQPSAVRTEDTFNAAEGISLTEGMPEAPSKAIPDPSSFELMAVSGPQILGHGKVQAAAISEAAGSPKAAEAPCEEAAAAERTEDSSSEQDDSKLEGKSDEAAATEQAEEHSGSPATEGQLHAEEQPANEQAHASLEPQHPAAEPVVTRIQEVTPGTYALHLISLNKTS